MQKFLLILMLSLPNVLFAQNKQSLRGKITDQLTLQPIDQATIIIIQPANGKGGRSDSMGNYQITELVPGRYTLKISSINYKEKLIPNILIESGKETVLDIGLEEEFKQLKGARVKASTKSRAQNELAAISARTFSMEEVNRYAGGRSDPARLAANFAGVSAPDDSRNDIVIRGNSPIGVLWRIEGMMVANPNHFATVGSTGGPVAALNTNMLKNSDFITSAFPAEYG
ncbi:MAG: carboxypeptidase regulatory-like domain-containing protein, partial [Chitinophagaceae bacterium]|nr:carboxypeptidase regulatory-like domain-containing protein [Chitinophagaceae bacterium]